MRLSEGLDLQSGDTAPRPVSHWRLSSRIEEHLLGTRQETVWLRTVFWANFGIAATYVLMFLRRSDLTDEVAWILHIKGYIIITLMHFALFYLYRRMINHLHIGPGMRRLKTKIPNDSAVPVRISVIQRGITTGIDEGFLWIDDGTIFFKGLQTVFRLNWEDIPPISLWDRKDVPNLGANRMPTTLPIPYEKRQLKIKYEILDAHEDFATRRKAAHFYSSLLEWLRDRPNSALETLLPPTDVHPGFCMPGRTTWEPVYGLAAIAAIDIALLLSMNLGVNLRGSSQAFAVLLSIILAIGGAVAIKNFILAYRTVTIRAELAKESPSL